MLIDEIAGRISAPEALCQIAEECGELTQAALKLRRALTGGNPTPVSVEKAEEAVLEELADVMVAWTVYSRRRYDESVDDHLQDLAAEKIRRWAQRLREAA